MSLFIPSPNEDNECCDEPCELDGPCEGCCPCKNLPDYIFVYPFTYIERGTSDPNEIRHPDCNDRMYETTSGSTIDGPEGKECAYGQFTYDDRTSTWSGPSNPPSSGCGGLFGIWKDDDGLPTHWVVSGTSTGSTQMRDGPYEVRTDYCGDQDCEEDPDTCTPPLNGKPRCAEDEIPCDDLGGCPDGTTECEDGVPFCTGDQPCCEPGTPIKGIHNCCECEDGEPLCHDRTHPCCEDGEPLCDDYTHPCCADGEPLCDDLTHPCCGDTPTCDDLTHPCCGDTPVCENTYPCCDGQVTCQDLADDPHACGSGIPFDPNDPCVSCCDETNDCIGPSGCCTETNDCPPDPCCSETNDCPPDPCCYETNDCPPDPCCSETNDCPPDPCCNDSPNCYDNCCEETNDCDPDPCQDSNCCDPDDYPPEPDGCVDCVEQTCQEVCEHYYIDTSL